MSKFIILHKDPLPYKEQILKFWETYLPGTPPARFEWMNQGNPAGPALWYFTFNRKTDDLAGMISVMPREIFLKGQTLKAGILGDFMVDEKYRVLGPTLDLPKAALSDGSKFGFQFFYTIPNHASAQIIKRIGFRKLAVLGNFVKILRTKSYLEKHLTRGLAPFAAHLLDFGLRLVSKESYLSARDFCFEESVVEESFDRLWERVAKSASAPIGDHCSAYVRWKYLDNPAHPCRILAYSKGCKGELSGYLVFTLRQGAMEILDLISLEKAVREQLLKKAIQIGHEEGCRAIYFTVSSHVAQTSEMRKFSFWNNRDDISLLGYGELYDAMTNWSFMAGDRNL